MKCFEITENRLVAPVRPQTPEQARLAALKRQKDNASKTLDAERKRQKVAKAQQSLQKALAVESPA
jgi:hypothetical protein